MSHPIKEFTDEQKDVIMELARLALADAHVYDTFAEELDLSDEFLGELQEELHRVTNGVDVQY